MSDIILVSATELEHNYKNLYGYPVNIVGIGKIEAGFNINKIISEHHPKLIINFGSCGNLKHYKPGEILQVGEVINDFFADKIYSYDKITISNSVIKCFTTDSFYIKNDNYHQEYLKNINNCDIVDMELYPIAYACKNYNIKLLSFKWVSDDGDADVWREAADLGFNNFKILLKQVLEDNNYKITKE
jgi:adenosylhomocysteine nucleosidase